MSAGQQQREEGRPLRRPAGSANGGDVETSTDSKRLFEQFHSKYRDAQGKKLRFTPAFNRHLEAIVADANLDVEPRASAWLLRQAWGNYSDFALNSKLGVRWTQRDCAKQLGVDESRISHVLADFKDRYLLRTEGQTLFPVADPETFALSSLKCADIHKLKGREGENGNSWGRFRSSWLAEHPTVAEKLTQARTEIKTIVTQILADYKAAYGPAAEPSEAEEDPSDDPESVHTSTNSKGGSCAHPQKSVAGIRKVDLPTPANSAAPILICLENPLKTEESVGQSSVVEEATDRPTETSSPDQPDREAQILEALEPLCDHLHEVAGPKLIKAIKTKLHDAPIEHLKERIRQRWSAMTSLGMITNLADDVGRAWKHGEAHRRKEAEAAARHEREAAQRAEKLTERNQRDEDNLARAQELFDAMPESQKARLRREKLQELKNQYRSAAAWTVTQRNENVDQTIVGDLARDGAGREKVRAAGV